MKYLPAKGAFLILKAKKSTLGSGRFSELEIFAFADPERLEKWSEKSIGKYFNWLLWLHVWLFRFIYLTKGHKVLLENEILLSAFRVIELGIQVGVLLFDWKFLAYYGVEATLVNIANISFCVYGPSLLWLWSMKV